MRILVTGANGFLGRSIVAELLRNNYEVFSLIRRKTKISDALPNVSEGDISDIESLSHLKQIKNSDTIIHAAGLAHQFGKTSAEDFWKINVAGTENVARLGAELEIRHFILISSVAVYGETSKNDVLVDESFSCQPKGVYAESKFASEQAAREICEKNDIALTVLRPATIIGEDDRGNTARLIKIIDGGKFVWIGKGENRKSLIYKKDVAEACVKVLENKTRQTEVFNVTGEPVKMNYIVSQISENLGRKIPEIKVSQRILETVFRLNSKTAKFGKIKKLSETIEKWTSEDIFSGEKIAEVYNFRARTSVSEALCRQIKNYKAEKAEKTETKRK